MTVVSMFHANDVCVCGGGGSLILNL